MKEKFEDRILRGSINIKLSDKGAFAGKRWEADKNELVRHIVEITTEYNNQGYRLSLRQLYYQLVRRNYILNDENVYAKMSTILDDCRYAGIVDWDIIEDRTRVPYTPYFENSIAEATKRLFDYYWLDKRQGQPNYVELWTEKDALSGIMKRAVDEYTITTVVNKGFASSSAIYGAYKKFAEKMHSGHKVIVLYFGDHDPSGLDMVRDIRERLMNMFRSVKGNAPWWIELKEIVKKKEKIEDWDEWLTGEIKQRWQMIRERFELRHIGLTKEQIEERDLPPNPAKLTDPRAKGYVKEHGEISWEVDALEPDDIIDIVHKELEGLIDFDILQEVNEREEKERKELSNFIKKYK